MRATAIGAVTGAVIMAAIAGTVWAGHSGGGTGEINSETTEKGRVGAASPVVVELFTSEGCSSCPSADAVLAKLEKQTSGVPIIALGLHVDYWNRLGWADPFSSKPFSDRQNEYAHAFQTDSVYTPQMVVDGQTEFVGSDEARANSAIKEAAQRPKASVTLAVQGSGAHGEAVSLRVNVGILPPGVQTGEVFAALTESGLSSQVARGENAGRHLTHASVVRKLVSFGTVGSKGGALSQTLEIPTSSRKQNLRAVVFVQDKATHHIIGAAQAGLNGGAL